MWSILVVACIQVSLVCFYSTRSRILNSSLQRRAILSVHHYSRLRWIACTEHTIADNCCFIHLLANNGITPGRLQESSGRNRSDYWRRSIVGFKRQRIASILELRCKRGFQVHSVYLFLFYIRFSQIHRYACPLPLGIHFFKAAWSLAEYNCITGVPHRVTEDDQYRNYFIPKNATVLANIWHVVW